jgi:beta-lactamase superfamily II metal-dependent hydrolase
MIRTFHPVGQGAFYTEVHEYNEQTFTIVYDCGSGTGSKTPNIIEKEIKKTFEKNHVIDVLFISHFHADHINGIDLLKSHCIIKCVIIPLLSPQAIVLTKIYNLLEKNYSETEIIDNPSEYFGEGTTIIRIEEGNNNENQIAVNPDNIINLSSAQQGTYQSGTIFTSNRIIDWNFVPYNYKQNVLIQLFESYLLINYNLSLSIIVTIDDIIEYKSKLIKAYKAINRHLNQNTMILYSGMQIHNRLKFKYSCLNWNELDGEHQVRYLKYLRITKTESGCLYTGDIDLNQNNIVTEIKHHYSDFLPFIGTIQIPHHGSHLSYNSDLFEKTIVHAIVSYGENTYGHPSECVLHYLCLKRILVHHVTSLSISKYTQHN